MPETSTSASQGSVVMRARESAPMLSSEEGATVERAGWKLRFAPSEVLGADRRAAVLEAVLGAAAGAAGTRVRVSTHGETWLANAGEIDLFIKITKPVRGFARIKRALRGGPAAHIAAVTGALRREGFNAPQPVVWGRELRGGRELIATVRAAGVLLPRLLREAGMPLAEKRAMLRELGAELARLHRAGFIHGDFTPFNVMVARSTPPARFVMLDHERTRRTRLAALARPRLRNLVQLGHFDLPGVTLTDRLRVWHGYAGARGEHRRRLRKLASMLHARVERDRARLASLKAARGESGKAGEV
jgi:hypothetical protein